MASCCGSIASGGEMAVPMLQPRMVGDDQVLAALDAGLTLVK